MDIHRFTIEMSKHALIRAWERGITPDMIEATIRGGIIEKFGKNNVRFIKQYKRKTVMCIDDIRGTTIVIVTVVIRE